MYIQSASSFVRWSVLQATRKPAARITSSPFPGNWWINPQRQGFAACIAF